MDIYLAISYRWPIAPSWKIFYGKLVNKNHISFRIYMFILYSLVVTTFRIT
jgi:hypothetical protein